MDSILSAEQIDNQQPRSSNYYGYVYLTTNLINGKMYIGAHKAREFTDKYKGSGKLLWRAINKYGWDNFKVEVLRWCFTKEELFEAERYEIEKRRAVCSNKYYNVMPGGYGGDNKTMLSSEDYDRFIQKLKSSKDRPRTDKEKAQMNRLHELNTGRPRSEETKRKLSISNRGQKRSEETKRHMSENHADVSGENNPFYGKKHSEETRKKMSVSNTRPSKGKIWITNKVDHELLVLRDDIDKYPCYVRGRLRKTQRNKLKEDKVQRLSR